MHRTYRRCTAAAVAEGQCGAGTTRRYHLPLFPPSAGGYGHCLLALEPALRSVDHYLQLRGEVEAVLGDLLKFAAELRRPGPELDGLHGLLTNIREPLLFVVVGEVKAGKSSLINALFGQEIAKADVLPATDRVCIFRYGRKEKQIEQSPKLIEIHLPLEFLRDFNIVDTPGTNTMVAEHQTITEDFVPRADLILFVFSVVSPWTQSAWEFLKFVQKKWLKNVVFVLQQTDLRDTKEVDVIKRHLQETAI